MDVVGSLETWVTVCRTTHQQRQLCYFSPYLMYCHMYVAIIDRVWPNNCIYWTIKPKIYDYIWQTSHSHALVVSVMFFTLLLGRGFYQQTFPFLRVSELSSCYSLTAATPALLNCLKKTLQRLLGHWLCRITLTAYIISAQTAQKKLFLIAVFSCCLTNTLVCEAILNNDCHVCLFHGYCLEQGVYVKLISPVSLLFPTASIIETHKGIWNLVHTLVDILGSHRC
jgi:hypothetical protein